MLKVTLRARLVSGIALLVIVFALSGKPESAEPRALPLPSPQSSLPRARGPASSTAPSEKRRAEHEQSFPSKTTEPTLPSAGLAGKDFLVRRVIDGDTIILDDGQVVRYIGMDAPEAGSRARPVECLAESATARNRALVEGRAVRLERDVSETDAYGRLLRYVFINGDLINAVLVREGFAASATFPPDLKYQDILRNAERAARSAQRGLFGERCRGSRRRPAESGEHPTAARRGPVSPDERDCAEFRTRAEAQAFFEAQGGPREDPHRLDQDGDGLACESLP